MIDPAFFFKLLSLNGIEFYTGVPDSLLKDFISYIYDNVEKKNHIIAANEGAAIAIASGTYLATGKPALVYMQNSGIGNAINPLLSLADPEVYSIPMILIIGWRGMIGVKDEPQHIKQGKIQNAILETMEIPYYVIGPEINENNLIIQDIYAETIKRSGPVAIVVKKGTFNKYVSPNLKENNNKLLMTREEALKIIIQMLDDNDIVVSTTGMTSREIFEIRAEIGSGHHRDFLTVGSMGHCSNISLGIALKSLKQQVYCIDGDGSLIMHMGSLLIIGQVAPSNLKHIVLNNAVHDSVGGFPTAISSTDLSAVTRGCGYLSFSRVETKEQLKESLTWLKNTKGPALLEINVRKGARSNLGRPHLTPFENRIQFQKYLRSCSL